MATEQQEAKEMKKDLHALRADVHKLAEALGERGNAHPSLGALRETIKETSHELGERLRLGWAHAYKNMQKKANQAAEYGRDAIKRKPITVVLSAVAVGALTTLLVRRR